MTLSEIVAIFIFGIVPLSVGIYGFVDYLVIRHRAKRYAKVRIARRNKQKQMETLMMLNENYIGKPFTEADI